MESENEMYHTCHKHGGQAEHVQLAVLEQAQQRARRRLLPRLPFAGHQQPAGRCVAVTAGTGLLRRRCRCLAGVLLAGTARKACTSLWVRLSKP